MTKRSPTIPHFSPCATRPGKETATEAPASPPAHPSSLPAKAAKALRKETAPPSEAVLAPIGTPAERKEAMPIWRAGTRKRRFLPGAESTMRRTQARPRAGNPHARQSVFHRQDSFARIPREDTAGCRSHCPLRRQEAACGIPADPRAERSCDGKTRCARRCPVQERHIAPGSLPPETVPDSRLPAKAKAAHRSRCRNPHKDRGRSAPGQRTPATARPSRNGSPRDIPTGAAHH